MAKDVFLTIMFNEEVDYDAVKQIAEKYKGVYLFKHSQGLYFSGDSTKGESLLFELGKLGFPMQVLH